MKKLVLCAVLSVLFIFCSCRSLQNPAPAENIETESETTTAATTAETTAPVTTAPETTAPENTEPVILTFFAVGDNLIHDNIYKEASEIAVSKNEGREYDFTPFYEPIAFDIRNADIAFINQETPLAGKSYGYTGYPMFNSPQELGDDLQTLGFDVVNIANNHMLDRRAEGLLSTIDFLDGKDMLQIGGYENGYDYYKMRILEKDGIKIAFLSFTYGTNGIVLDKGSDIVIPQFSDGYTVDERMLKNAVALAESAGDVTIVSMHWGNENTFEISYEQKTAAKILNEAGADVIIGTHPHVIQTAEWLEAENGNRTLVYYSLGNVISAQTPLANMLGGIAEFRIIKNGSEPLYIGDEKLTPTMTYFNSNFRKTTVYKLEDFPEELVKTHGRSGVSSKSKEQIVQVIKDNIDCEFIADYYRE
ncbi:MAG: CapA family protein [Ruminococcus sp.]|jgi:poly-gamma-glutamate synthesis protein (capsule biosynthesis protein)|nr:CapA family protein [Ruminococcus sp.]